MAPTDLFRSAGALALLLLVALASGCPSSGADDHAGPDAGDEADLPSPRLDDTAQLDADVAAPLDGAADGAPLDVPAIPDGTPPDVPLPGDVPLPWDVPLPADVPPMDDVRPPDDVATGPTPPIVGTTQEGRQWGAEVAALRDGGFVVAWMSSTADAQQAWVVVRVFAANGSPRTAEIPVDPVPGARQGFPAVTALADGGFAVVWPVAELGDPSQYALVGRTFAASGAPAGEIIPLTPWDTNGQRNPHLSTLASGDLVLAWEWDRYDGSSGSVVARVLAPTLVPRGANLLVADITDDVQSTPRSAPLPPGVPTDGGFLVTWESTITAGYDVRARLFSASGEATGPEFPVNVYDTNGVQRGARPLSLPSGELFVVYGDESGAFGATVKVFDATGANVTWSGEVAGDLTWIGQPAVAAHPRGATVFFQARPASGDPLAIWRSDWSLEERALSPPALVYASAEGFQSSPEATALRYGGQVVVWECDDADREGVCLAVLSTGVEGPPDWDDPTCALAWETCAPVFPGCYFSDGCPEVADCPITGCGTDGPAVASIVFGNDACGVPWVVLQEPTGRLSTRPWTERPATESTPFLFDVLLDGEPTTRCSIEGLPTGAIRYQLLCHAADGSPAYAAVLEPDGPGECAGCSDPAGCYRVDAPPILCQTILPCPETPERARIDSVGGCTAALRLEEPPASALSAWLSHNGFLTLRFGALGTAGACTLAPDGNGYGPAVCTLPQAGGPLSMALDLHLARIGDPTCELPQCIQDATCEGQRIGDRCDGGRCTCEGGAACGEGTVCAPGSGAPGGCAPVDLWDDPRTCRTTADCRACLAEADPVCCDQIVDGSALDAVNVFHDCPTCCTCSLSCEGVVPPRGVECAAGRCRYTW